MGREPLTPLEALIADVIELHPEYQALVADVQSAGAFALETNDGRENPYLHMGLHLAVREQLAVDRPPGIRDLHRTLLAERGNAHAAEHALMEALGETLWEARRRGVAPDEREYSRARGAGRRSHARALSGEEIERSLSKLHRPSIGTAPDREYSRPLRALPDRRGKGAAKSAYIAHCVANP